VASLKTLNHNLNKIALSRQYWPEDMRLISSEKETATIQGSNEGNIQQEQI
jgi:hypothetical protein